MSSAPGENVLGAPVENHLEKIAGGERELVMVGKLKKAQKFWKKVSSEPFRPTPVASFIVDDSA